MVPRSPARTWWSGKFAVTMMVSRIRISLISCYLSSCCRFYRDQFGLVLSRSYDPYGSYPAGFSLRALQRGSDSVFLPEGRWLTGIRWLCQVLGTDVGFQSFPFLSRVAHLIEKSRFILAGVVFWVESIVAQLACIYFSLLCIGQLSRHAGIIA